MWFLQCCKISSQENQITNEDKQPKSTKSNKKFSQYYSSPISEENSAALSQSSNANYVTQFNNKNHSQHVDSKNSQDGFLSYLAGSFRINTELYFLITHYQTTMNLISNSIKSNKIKNAYIVKLQQHLDDNIAQYSQWKFNSQNRNSHIGNDDIILIQNILTNRFLGVEFNNSSKQYEINCYEKPQDDCVQWKVNFLSEELGVKNRYLITLMHVASGGYLSIIQKRQKGNNMKVIPTLTFSYERYNIWMLNLITQLE